LLRLPLATFDGDEDGRGADGEANRGIHLAELARDHVRHMVGRRDNGSLPREGLLDVGNKVLKFAPARIVSTVLDAGVRHGSTRGSRPGRDLRRRTGRDRSPTA